MAAKGSEEIREARREAEILGIGMVTAVGLSARQTAASVRTGIGRLEESYVTDRYGEMLVMGLVDAGELPALNEELADPDDPGQELSPRQERVARLAGPALLEAIACHVDLHVPAPARASVPLLLALPEAHPETRQAIGPEMLEILETQTERRFEPELSRTYALGRAGGFAALDDALDLLGGRDRRVDRRRAPPLVVVGGVDSYLDLGLLYALDGEGRLRTGEVTDGFVPGEGAAFLVLGPPGSAARTGRRALARITGVGRAHEAGHIYSSEPNRGDGLATAFSTLFERAGGGAPIRNVARVYAGLNGESYWAKEWGVAQIRCAGRFRERLHVRHPADCFGDAGAALGLIMLGLAALDLSRGRIDGDCLVWGGADRGERGAALLAR